MKKSNIDLPVLIIFFARPSTLEKVFEEVKKARPSKLFLACDGPRNEKDLKKINECKEIVKNIDWECEVHTNYSEENKGCGKGPSDAVSWAFSFVDRLVILEDDCVPHSGFFQYMYEMLEYYNNDLRIVVIAGFNHFLNWDCGKYSYFFTKNGPMAGAWGTWKRVWEDYKYDVSAISDPLIENLVYNDILLPRAKKQKIELWKQTEKKVKNNENISYWDVQFGFLKYYMSYLTIVPKFSLVSNIGLGEDSTHALNAQNSMPSIFFSKDNNFEFPIIHTPFVICDHKYDITVDNAWGYPSFFRKYKGKLTRGVRKIIKHVFKREN